MYLPCYIPSQAQAQIELPVQEKGKENYKMVVIYDFYRKKRHNIWSQNTTKSTTGSFEFKY